MPVVEAMVECCCGHELIGFCQPLKIAHLGSVKIGMPSASDYAANILTCFSTPSRKATDDENSNRSQRDDQ
jgi:hypothetical protein